MRVRSGDGTTLSVTVRGPRVAPTVVLVHGLGLSARSWELVAVRLVGRHRVVAYDLRGHVTSEMAATGDYGLAAQAADLDAFLAAVVLPGRREVLVGHSPGGEIILARAVSSLEGIAGVVFAGSAGRWLVFTPGDPADAVRAARVDFLATDPGVLARTTLTSVSDDGSRMAPSLWVPALILRSDRDRKSAARPRGGCCRVCPTLAWLLCLGPGTCCP